MPGDGDEDEGEDEATLDADGAHTHLHRRLQGRQFRGSANQLAIGSALAQEIWDEGFRGADVRIAVFDSGFPESHPHFFENVVERSNWTNEKQLNDDIGHGTYVAGVIASSSEACPGVAPDAKIYTFRTFTSQQMSYTSWFLDAFNYALFLQVDVLNLSIGGPDFLDQPFADKVHEVVAAGIVVVSAIGNDGPVFGTLNNPGDMFNVLGVGAHTLDRRVAAFQSRGMTGGERGPYQYGRPKPDILAPGQNILGPLPRGTGCRAMSGTSVASPVVAGVVALIKNAADWAARNSTRVEGTRRGLGVGFFNPGSVKQVLLDTADRVVYSEAEAKAGQQAALWSSDVSKRYNDVYVQGGGILNVPRAFFYMRDEYTPRVSAFPAAVDVRDCPMAGPNVCSGLPKVLPQWLNSATAHNGKGTMLPPQLPLVLNFTIINPVSLASKVLRVRWVPFTAPLPQNKGGEPWHPRPDAALRVRVSHAPVLYPYGGTLGVAVELLDQTEGLYLAGGKLHAQIGDLYDKSLQSDLVVPIVLRVGQGRPRRDEVSLDATGAEVTDTRRVFWDLFHSIPYPPSYSPRDDLRLDDFLDWHGDHPHTNYRGAWEKLQVYAVSMGKQVGIELVTTDIGCAYLPRGSTYLLVDPEDGFFPEEVQLLRQHVLQNSGNLVVFADWFSGTLADELPFFDDNTRVTWYPVVDGGANVPALNRLLGEFGFAFGQKSYTRESVDEGAGLDFGFGFGNALVKAPRGSRVLKMPMRLHERLPGQSRLRGGQVEERLVYAVYEDRDRYPQMGRVVVFGDSSCIDVDSKDKKNYCWGIWEHAMKSTYGRGLSRGSFEKLVGKMVDGADEIEARLEYLKEDFVENPKVDTKPEGPRDLQEWVNGKRVTRVWGHNFGDTCSVFDDSFYDVQGERM
uniref:subtilisin n=1 Tax=Phaeomonas parva TaxID=124430 RepID=A0A7S1XRI8_9STRA